MPRSIPLFATALFVAVFGCASKHEHGVTSDYRSQWTTVNAGTQATTDAAKMVLEQRGLKDVSADATGVDGVAKAKTADGTKITVNVKKKSDTSSDVSVTVGTLGDPKLGADIAKQTKIQAETMPHTMMSTPYSK